MHSTPQRATRRPYRTSLLINLGGSLLWSVHSLHNGPKGVSVCNLHSGLLGGGQSTKDFKDHLKTTHSQLEVFRPCFLLEIGILYALLGVIVIAHSYVLKQIL